MATEVTDRNLSTPTFFVAVHVGAGYHSPSNERVLRSAMKRACLAAASVLRKGAGGCIDAVTAAIKVLEDDPNTNAGRGSNLTEDGHVECDASIMDGDSGAFGAVGAVPGVRNAIEIAALLAKEQISGSSLLGRISPMFLVGEGACAWAKSKGVVLPSTITTADESLVTEKARTQWKRYKAMLDDAKTVIDAPDIKLTNAKETNAISDFRVLDHDHNWVLMIKGKSKSKTLKEKILDIELHRLEATEETWKLACKFLDHKHLTKNDESEYSHSWKQIAVKTNNVNNQPRNKTSDVSTYIIKKKTERESYLVKEDKDRHMSNSYLKESYPVGHFILKTVDVLFPSFEFEEITSFGFSSARLFPSSVDLGFGISVLTVEMFLALGASGTSPTILLGVIFPFGFEFLFGQASKCSHKSKNSLMFSA
ncbi:hypothetical protein H5410_028469 [Solanum commersonii]|uniref:Threonine aspartase n=1 Tax=Solanum commersonii TaxID=4109 RepID=A0A9J5Z269_SOLCO|nr:hypothetical protein H5410_028469 [Solanum commersonii]